MLDHSPSGSNLKTLVIQSLQPFMKGIETILTYAPYILLFLNIMLGFQTSMGKTEFESFNVLGVLQGFFCLFVVGIFLLSYIVS